jgi:galactokinase
MSLDASSRRALREFQSAFQSQPELLVRAPRRLELLGNHTDYNQGLVLATTLDLAVTVAAGRRPDAIHRLHSSAFPDADLQVRRNGGRSLPRGHWARYAWALLRELEREGLSSGGWDISVCSDLPPGAGLSSSAALLVAIAIAAGGLPHRTASQRLRIARLCQAAEHRVGVPCGLLDYLAILHGKPGHALQLDLRSPRVRPIPWPRSLALVLIDSGVRHQLSGGGYARIERACATAARSLRVASLREVTATTLNGFLATAGRRLRPESLDVVHHLLTENQRVRRAVRALEHGQSGALGTLLVESHSSSRDRLRNSTPELDDWVSRCASAPGWLGGRLTGGGFGGMTVHLVQALRQRAFLSHLPPGTSALAAPLGGGIRAIPVHRSAGRSIQVFDRK